MKCENDKEKIIISFNEIEEKDSMNLYNYNPDIWKTVNVFYGNSAIPQKLKNHETPNKKPLLLQFLQRSTSQIAPKSRNLNLTFQDSPDCENTEENENDFVKNEIKRGPLKKATITNLSESQKIKVERTWNPNETKEIVLANEIDKNTQKIWETRNFKNKLIDTKMKKKQINSLNLNKTMINIEKPNIIFSPMKTHIKLYENLNESSNNTRKSPIKINLKNNKEYLKEYKIQLILNEKLTKLHKNIAERQKYHSEIKEKLLQQNENKNDLILEKTLKLKEVTKQTEILENLNSETSRIFIMFLIKI